jgi:hypothetical protein
MTASRCYPKKDFYELIGGDGRVVVIHLIAALRSLNFNAIKLLIVLVGRIKYTLNSSVAWDW